MNVRPIITVSLALFGILAIHPSDAGLRKSDDYPNSVSVQRAENVKPFQTKRADVITKVQGITLPMRVPVPSFIKVYYAACDTDTDGHLCDIRAYVNTNDVDRCIAYYDGVFWDHKWARYITAGEHMRSVHLPTLFADHPALSEDSYAFYLLSGDLSHSFTAGRIIIKRTTPGSKVAAQELRLILTWPVNVK